MSVNPENNGNDSSPAVRAREGLASSVAVQQCLELFAEAAGLDTHFEAIAEAVHNAERDVSHSAMSWWGACIVRAGGEIGLNIFRLRRRLNQVYRLARAGTPWIAQAPGGKLVALLGRKGRKLRVMVLAAGASEEVLTLAETQQLLGIASENDFLDWATAETALPLAGMASHDHHGHHRSPLSRLAAILRTEKRDIWVVVVYSIAIGLLSLAVPIAVQSLVNTVAFGAVIQPLVVLTLFVFAALGFSALLNSMRLYVVELMQQRFFVRVAGDVVHRLVRARADAFDKHHGPELVNRFFDVVTVQKSGAMLLLDGISVAMQTVIGMALLAVYHPWLLAFDVILLLVGAYVIFGLGRGAIRTSIQESRHKYEVAAWLEETARHFITFKSDYAAAYATQRADNILRSYIDARRRHFRILIRQIAGSLTVQALASAVLLGIGGWLVIERQLTLGQLVAAELIVTSVVSGFAKFGKHLEGFYDMAAAIDKLGHLVDLPLERTGGMAPLFSSRPASVRFREVSFGYANAPHILKQADFELKAGTKVGLTGPRGSGKSAILDLMYGLRQPKSGVVEFDGTDYRDLSLPDLRSQVALVRAEGIFEGSIFENVRLGRPELGVAEVRQALADVGILQEVLALPQALQTELSTEGLPLSPGQAARLMLARAIAGKPRLMLLDDCVEDVGEIREEDPLLKTLFDTRAPWTLLIVTENRFLLEHCEQVFTLEGGQLQEAALSGWNGRVTQ